MEEKEEKEGKRGKKDWHLRLHEVRPAHPDLRAQERLGHLPRLRPPLRRGVMERMMMMWRRRRRFRLNCSDCWPKIYSKFGVFARIRSPAPCLELQEGKVHLRLEREEHVLPPAGLLEDPDPGLVEPRRVADVLEGGEPGEEHVQLDAGHQALPQLRDRHIPGLAPHLGRGRRRGRRRPGSRKPRACEPGSQIVCLPADNF